MVLRVPNYIREPLTSVTHQSLCGNCIIPVNQRCISVLSEYKGNKIDFVSKSSAFIVSYLGKGFKMSPENSTVCGLIWAERW